MFLVGEATMAQRLARAKAKIAKARIPYRVPAGSDLPERVVGVLAVVYLVFPEGHTAGAGGQAVRDELCVEAIRLGRLLVELMPDEPEAVGLLALMLLTDARRPARVSADGDLVPLAEQDRSRWDAGLIAEGHTLVRRCLRRDRPGPYQLQAAINAVHTDAARPQDTDWRQLLALHDQLAARDPSPVVALNRAVVLAEVAGPAAALAVVEGLELPRYHLAHVVAADLLTRLGRGAEAARAYDAALGLTANAAEQRLLGRRRAALGADPAPASGAIP